LFLKALCYQIKGDLDLCIKLYKQSLVIFKELNNKPYIAAILNNLSDMYKMKGELERALECSEQSLAIFNELKLLKEVAIAHDSLIQILIEKGDLKKAQEYINQLEQMNIELKSKQINLSILFNKALILKKSSRIINKGKAAEIFKQILEDEASPIEIILRSLLNLCELLLFELNATNDPEILDEFQTYISRLSSIVQNTRSYWLLAETYLLQARVSLLTLNINKARRLFAKSQDLAEKYGLSPLAMRISNEHDELLKQLEIWEKLKDSNAPLTERMELSHINEQMERMVRERVVSLPKLEAEQPILLTLMTKEGNVLLSNPFTADLTIDSNYFSEFLSSCNTFCDQIFSETFDRVKFGQNTVLITSVDSFSVCYMFQGQSYSARQKLLHFSETIKKEPGVMEILKDARNKNIEVKVNETASLEELIFESFLSDPEQFQMPFKAYEEDGPFIFVSYSHSDRLQVYPIIDYLNKTGINIWYDEGIPVSEDWKNSIVENIERCSAFLVFITPRIIDSEYVQKEISFALKRQKPFFSVYLKETQLPSEIEFEIGDIQFMRKYLML
ncbi:MAG: TIR domain-containing protein, partial [Candidatus Hodarchaeota archaeon]